MKFRGLIDRLKRIERIMNPPDHPLILVLRHDEPVPEDVNPRTILVVTADLSVDEQTTSVTPAHPIKPELKVL